MGAISLASTTITNTAYALYNQGGDLYWNGSILSSSSGSGLPSGTDGQTLYFDGSAWAATSSLTVATSTGYVGIGTINPQTALEVAGTVSSTNLQVNGNATTTGTLYVGSLNINTLNGGVLIATNGIVGTSTVDLSSSAMVSGTLPVANGGTGLGAVATGAILFGSGINPLATSSNFTWTNNNLLQVIGTVSSTALQVNGNATVTQSLVVGTSTFDGFAYATGSMSVQNTLYANIVSSSAYYLNGNALSALPSGTAGQTLYYSGSAWTPTSTLTIATSTGNVGIGTTNPQTALDVTGAVRIDATSSGQYATLIKSVTNNELDFQNIVSVTSTSQSSAIAGDGRGNSHA